MTPAGILLRLALIFVAFKAANQSERPVVRALGLGYLIAIGILTTFAAASGAGVLYWAIGLGMIILGTYTYWTNR